MAEEQAGSAINPVALATELTIAWLGNPNVRATAEEVPAFLKSMHATIDELSNGSDSPPADAAPEYTPAVPVRSSVKPDYIVSLIDGRKLKSLKRHLSTHGLTPDEYRARYGLKPDYPMVAVNYSAARRAVAQKLGLGRRGASAKAGDAAPQPAAAAPAPAKRGDRATKPAGAKRAPRKKAEAPAS